MAAENRVSDGHSRLEICEGCKKFRKYQSNDCRIIA